MNKWNPKITLQPNFSFQFLTLLPSKPFPRVGRRLGVRQVKISVTPQLSLPAAFWSKQVAYNNGSNQPKLTSRQQILKAKIIHQQPRAACIWEQTWQNSFTAPTRPPHPHGPSPSRRRHLRVTAAEIQYLSNVRKPLLFQFLPYG